MDFLRSAYSTDCQWFEDGTIGKIVWYKCDPGAEALPFPHIFSSTNWMADGLCEGGVGEVFAAPVKWRDGSKPQPGFETRRYCGTPEMFQHGLPAMPEPPPAFNQYGHLECCDDPRPEVCKAINLELPDTYTVRTVGSSYAGMFKIAWIDNVVVLNRVDACTFRAENVFAFVSGFTGVPVEGPLVLQFAHPTQARATYGPANLAVTGQWITPLGPARVNPYLPVFVQGSFLSGTEFPMTFIPGVVSDNACPALTRTSPVYYPSFSASGPIPPITDFAFFPEAGTYSVFQDTLCTWTGSVFVDRFDNLQIPRRQGAVPLEMSVDGAGILTVRVKMSVFGNIFQDGVYTSAGPWDGVTPVGLLPASVPPGTVYYGNVCTVNPPQTP
jgi:hypothetical protein